MKYYALCKKKRICPRTIRRGNLISVEQNMSDKNFRSIYFVDNNRVVLTILYFVLFMSVIFLVGEQYKRHTTSFVLTLSPDRD
jgi:hypothetical protein